MNGDPPARATSVPVMTAAAPAGGKASSSVGHRCRVPPRRHHAAPAMTHTAAPTTTPRSEQPIRAPVLSGDWHSASSRPRRRSPSGWLRPGNRPGSPAQPLIAAVYIGFAGGGRKTQGNRRRDARSPGAFVVLAAAERDRIGVGARRRLCRATGSRTSGRPAASTSPTPDGGRRSVPPSTGSSPRSSSSRSWQEPDFITSQAPPNSSTCGYAGRATLTAAFRSRTAIGTAARINAPVRANAAG